MSNLTKKTTICFEPEVLEFLRNKAAEESSSISYIIHDALKVLFTEDLEDIADFDARIGEPNVSYAEFVKSLKADGVI